MTDLQPSSSTPPAPVAGDLPPFRADHVGSLLRPPSVVAARAQRAAGQLDAAGLRAVEDAALPELVALQARAGLRSVTDGEVRRSSWHMDFLSRLGGVSTESSDQQVHFHGASGDIDFTPRALRVTGPVHLAETIFADDFTALRGAAGEGVVPKLTIPSPNMLLIRSGSVPASVYPDREEFRSDLAAAYRAQIAALGELGCRYLQLDDTSLAYLNDRDQQAALVARGEDLAAVTRERVENLNAAVAGRPVGMAVTTHLCRGNYRSSWATSGGYDDVAEVLFGEADVDGFFLEFDDERSGTFGPLRFVRPGTRVVLGLVTTKSGALESADDLARRIDEAAQHVPLDQLCLSPQCGFASTEEGNDLTAAEQEAKLRLVVEVAERVWG